MSHGESTKDMYMRFTEIINNLKSLGKTCTIEKMMRKSVAVSAKKQVGIQSQDP